tara:strand:+ start:3601 stop:4449 length:849 start_codon:yes stop_codon:yes gene_type:complete
MSVKPITNPFPISPNSINRANQVSDKNINVGRTISNSSKTSLPGKDFTKNHEIVVKDLDSTIISHVKRTMNIKIEDNGELVNLPVMYGNQERWVNIKQDGFIRDKNGSLILPLLMLRRANIEFNDTLPSYKHDLSGENIQVVRSSHWSKSNYYDRFTVDKGLKPVEENMVTGVPQFVNVSYDFIGWTQYIEQMNKIIENFSDQHNRYWGDNTSYRFLCTIPAGLSDVVEMENVSERSVRCNFTVMLKGYLLPEVISNIINNRRFNAKRTLTKRKLVFSEKIE